MLSGRLADDGCGAVAEVRGASTAAGAGVAVDRRPRGAGSCADTVSEPRAVRAVDLEGAECDPREGPSERAEDPLALVSVAGSAVATAGTDAIATPTPSATAKAPTRPTYRAGIESKTTAMLNP